MPSLFKGEDPRARPGWEQSTPGTPGLVTLPLAFLWTHCHAGGEATVALRGRSFQTSTGPPGDIGRDCGAAPRTRRMRTHRRGAAGAAEPQTRRPAWLPGPRRLRHKLEGRPVPVVLAAQGLRARVFPCLVPWSQPSASSRAKYEVIFKK